MMASPSVNPLSHPPPLNLDSWISLHSSDFHPPVCNRMIYSEGTEFQLMVVGGPNHRTDYHTEACEEWFLMIKGSMTLKVVDGGIFKDIVIKEGESFLLPPNIPHSPQREANTLGLVLEKRRPAGSLDGLRWFCPCCDAIVHELFFPLENLGAQLTAAIGEYYSTETMRKCKNCGHLDQQLDKRGVISRHSSPVVHNFPTINSATHPPPFHLNGWVSANSHLFQPPVCNSMIHSVGCQFQVMVVGGPNIRTDYHINRGEEWFFMLKGAMILKIVDGGEMKEIHIKEGESFLLPANIPHSPQRFANTYGLVIERERAADEPDVVQWYCPNPECREIIRSFSFHCSDLVKQLKELIFAWYQETPEAREIRTCKKCGSLESKPVASAALALEQKLEEKSQ